MTPPDSASAPVRRRRRASTNGTTRAGAAASSATWTPAPPALPEGWRAFVGRWLETSGCAVRDAARGDWEVELSEPLRRRWRRQRVRLVFDPLRATLPRGAWFTAPGSAAGRKLLEAALHEPVVTARTALAQVPGVSEQGLGAVCRVRGLTWGPPRLGPVRYERRISFHAVATRWGGLPWQEPWVVLVDGENTCVEWHRAQELPDVRAREGLYQLGEPLAPEARTRWVAGARAAFESLLETREQEWEHAIARLREDELERLGAFFSARIEEEEERLRRRGPNGDDGDLTGGDARSLKLEWERRAQEVRARWALHTEVRLWGISEWSWPVAEVTQELRSGAVHVRLTSAVDVARGRPELPPCPHCGSPADLLVRARGSVACSRCA